MFPSNRIQQDYFVKPKDSRQTQQYELQLTSERFQLLQDSSPVHCPIICVGIDRREKRELKQPSMERDPIIHAQEQGAEGVLRIKRKVSRS